MTDQELERGMQAAAAALNEANARIAELTAEVSNRWISVKDRMPAKDIPVLVCQQIYGRRIMVWDGMNWRCEEPGDTLPPHHWMPLPTAPASDKHEIGPPEGFGSNRSKVPQAGEYGSGDSGGPTDSDGRDVLDSIDPDEWDDGSDPAADRQSDD